MLTTGQIITNNDGYMGTVTVDNVVRELLAAGKTWKEYSESIPYQGYDGGDTGEYAERHNPLSYMSDVRNDPSSSRTWCRLPSWPPTLPIMLCRITVHRSQPAARCA